METKGDVLIPATPEVIQTQPQERPLVKPLMPKKPKKTTLFMIIGSFIVVVLGVISGWFLAGTRQAGKTENQTSQSALSNNQSEEAGVGDEKSFGSTAEGILKKGGIKGEGTHYIDRGLGESKYVYLTSSLVDLDSFIDKKVVVWGETISAKYAGWLIDVGKIKVVK
jgi:hypothetical protein